MCRNSTVALGALGITILLDLAQLDALPGQVVMTMHACVGSFMAMPKAIPSGVHHHHNHPILQTELQSFSWTERQLPDKVRKRDERVDNPRIHREPMFCFETSLKVGFTSKPASRRERMGKRPAKWCFAVEGAFEDAVQ
jgi:hypothetical protein